MQLPDTLHEARVALLELIEENKQLAADNERLKQLLERENERMKLPYILRPAHLTKILPFKKTKIYDLFNQGKLPMIELAGEKGIHRDRLFDQLDKIS